MTFTITIRQAAGATVYKAIDAQHALSRLRRSRRGEFFQIDVVDDATRIELDETSLEVLTDNPGL